MINVKLPTILRPHAGGQPEVQTDGATLREVLDNLEEQYPGLTGGLRTEDGTLHRHVNVYVNGEDVRYLGSLDAALDEGDTVAILPAVAGATRRRVFRHRGLAEYVRFAAGGRLLLSIDSTGAAPAAPAASVDARNGEGIANHNGQTTWWGGNLMGARDFPVRLQVPNRLVYSPHEYPASMYPQSWFSDSNYPDNLPVVWDKYWGYLATDTPILIGEFGTRLETEKDRQWLQKFSSYIKSKHLHWTFWSLNPNSGDTGGLLLDDWLSVHKEKQSILQAIQYPSPDSGKQLSTPTILPSVAAPATSTATMPNRILVLDDFESGRFENWGIFRSPNSHVGASLVTPGHVGSYAIRISYIISDGGWGGVERHFDGSQTWKGYQSIGFCFFGTNSGATIRFEILDNRAPGRQGDSAERFEYKFSDNFNGWRTFRLPWNAFNRRSDWQPEGAPNDGFNLTEVWGFNFSPLAGAGSFQLDDIRLSDP